MEERNGDITDETFKTYYQTLLDDSIERLRDKAIGRHTCAYFDAKGLAGDFKDETHEFMQLLMLKRDAYYVCAKELEHQLAEGVSAIGTGAYHKIEDNLHLITSSFTIKAIETPDRVLISLLESDVLQMRELWEEAVREIEMKGCPLDVQKAYGLAGIVI